MQLYEKASEESRRTGNPVNMAKVFQEFNDLFIHAGPEELKMGNAIAGLHRGQDGKFTDAGISQTLYHKYEQVASRIGYVSGSLHISNTVTKSLVLIHIYITVTV